MQFPKGQLPPPFLPSLADPAVAPMSEHRFSTVPREEPSCHLSKKAKRCLAIALCVLVAVIIAVVVGVLKWPRAPQHREWSGTGTTPHLSEIVLGRCYTYTQVLRPELR